MNQKKHSASSASSSVRPSGLVFVRGHYRRNQTHVANEKERLGELLQFVLAIHLPQQEEHLLAMHVL